MTNLNRQYETTKQQANEFMQNGQITKYFEALLQMNQYKRLMTAVIAN